MATATETTTERVIEGYIIRYDSLSAPWELQGGRLLSEKFARGAFAESVAEIVAGTRAVKVNVEHGRDNALLQIGMTGDNVTLEHRDDGVYMRMVLGGDSVSDDLYEKIKRHWVDGLSIEFQKYPGEEPAYQSIGNNYVRTISRARLDGFAIVAEPRYPDARVFARSVNDDEKARLESEVTAYDRAKADRLKLYMLEFSLLHGVKF